MSEGLEQFVEFNAGHISKFFHKILLYANGKGEYWVDYGTELPKEAFFGHYGTAEKK